MSRFDDFTKTVDLKSCSVDYSQFDIECGYVCPNLEVEMSIYGTDVTLGYWPDDGGIITHEVIHTDDKNIEKEIKNFINENKDALRDAIEASEEVRDARLDYDTFYNEQMEEKEKEIQKGKANRGLGRE